MYTATVQIMTLSYGNVALFLKHAVFQSHIISFVNCHSSRKRVMDVATWFIHRT